MTSTANPYAGVLDRLDQGDSADPGAAPDPSVAAAQQVATSPEVSYAGALDAWEGRRKDESDITAQWAKFRQENTPMAPDRQAEVFRTASALRENGQTPDLSVVSDNLDEYKRKAEAAGAHWDSILSDHPGLRDFLLENPHRQALVADDLANLDGIAWATQVPMYAAKRDIMQQEFYARSFEKFAQGATKDEAIAGLQGEIGKGYGAETWLSSAYARSLNLVPMLTQFTTAGAIGGKLGAIAAAPAAGALAPETGGLGAGAAELAGAAGGAALATAALTYYQTVGPAYIRLLDQGVRPEIAGPLASAEAGVTGLIFGGALPGLLAKLGVPVAPTVSEIASGTAAALEKQTFSKVVKETVQQVGENVAHAAVMMGAVGAVSQTTTEVGGWLERGESVSGERISQAMGESMLQAVKDMAVISAIAPFGDAFHNMGEAYRLADDQRQIETLFSATEKSKTLERAPDEFEQLVATLSQRGLKKLYAPVEDFNTYWSSRRGDPREVAARLMNDEGRAYDEAVATGGDLALPVERYTAVLGRTEHLRGLGPDLKIRPDGRTPRQEQKRLEQRAEELAKQPDLGQHMEEGKRLVEDFFRQSILRTLTGNRDIADPEAVATATARENAAAFDKMAQQINAAASEGTKPIHAYDVLRARARVEFTSKGGAVRAGNVLRDERDVVDPASTANLKQRVSGAEELLQRDVYVDPVTGLYSATGDDARAPDPTRPLRARFSIEGFKLLNDTYGHTAGDGALRTAAQALAAIIPDAAKRGGDLEADVADEAQAKKIAAAIEQALDPAGRLHVTFAAAPRAGSYEQTGAAVGDLLAARKAERIGKGEIGHRLGGPAAFMPKDLQIAFEKDHPGVPLDSPEAKAAITEAARQLEPIAQRVKGGAAVSDIAITPDQVNNFRAQTDRAFDAAYRDPSGLLNATGFMRAQETNPQPFTASIDARAFKMSDTVFGRKGGDDIARILSEKLADWGGGEFDVARKGGDEFAAQSSDRAALETWLRDAAEGLQRLVFYRKLDDGRFALQEGLYIAHGIGPDFEHADRVALPEAKRQQDLAGFRKPEILDAESFSRRATQSRGDHPDRQWIEVRGAGEGRDAAQLGERARGASGPGGGGAPADGAVESAARVEGQPTRSAGGEANGGGLPGAPGEVPAERPGSSGAPDAGGAAGLGTRAQTGRVEFKAARRRVDSATKARAWSTDDAFEQVMLSIGGADAGPSEQADYAYRKFGNGNGPRPPPFAGRGEGRDGTFDTINRDLRDHLGADFKGVSGALEAWDLLLQVELAPDGVRKRQLDPRTLARARPVLGREHLRWDRIKKVIDLMQTVPGFEKLDLPDTVHERLAEADWLKHYGDDEAAQALLKQEAFHGTPHRGIEHEGFKLNKIGTGEGAQVYGWGIYATQTKDIAETFRQKLSKDGAGQTYKIEVPENDELLDYDKPLEEQPEKIRKILESDPVISRVIDPGVKGHDIYDRLATELGNERTASLVLNSAGIHGMRYLDEYSRSPFGKQAHNFVVWDESKMPITGTLHQPGRGEIEFNLSTGSGEPRLYTINLDGADESTAAHETFHMLTEVMHDVATAADAPPALRADYDKLLAFMGHASPEERVANAKERIRLANRKKAGETLSADDEKRLTTLEAKEERATYAWEQYLREGKSPSAQLVGVFAQFGAWMARVYRGGDDPSKRFSQEYGEELGLTPEVRAIFDRLLASDEQIERTREAYASRPTNAERDAMTDEERREYDQLTYQAQNRARDEVQRVLVRDNAAREKLIEEHRADLEEERSRELDRQPAYRALSFLQDGLMLDADGEPADVPDWLTKDGEPLKLDRKAVDVLLGKKGWRTLHAKTTAKDGAPPDEVATALGFASGEALIRSLQVDVTPPRSQVVRSYVQERIREIYGQALIDDASALFDQAMAAQHNASEARRILLGIRAMRRKLDPNLDPRAETVTGRTLEDTARRMIDTRTIDHLSPNPFVQAGQSAAKRAYEAALAGKIDVAIAERETQLLNHHLYTFAREAEERAAHLRTQIEKKTSESYRSAMGRAVREERLPDGRIVAHRDYLDAHDAILNSIGIWPKAPTQFDYNALLDRMDSEAADLGFDPTVVGEVIRARTPFEKLTLGKAEEVYAAIKNIRAASNAALDVIVGDKRLAVKEIANGIGDWMRGNRPDLGAPPLAKTQVSQARRSLLTAQSVDGMAIDMTTLVDMMGPKAREFVEDRYATARAKRDGLRERVLSQVVGAYEKMPAALRERRFEVVKELDDDLPVPAEMSASGARDRQWLWMVYLNMGNRGPKSNMERLIRPFKWTEGQVLDALGKHLTREECTFLQSVLDTTDGEVWEEIAAKEERKKGLRPEKIQASPINLTFADGTTQSFRGGYFPARYDPELAEGPIGEKQTEGVIAAYYGAGYERASTPKSHTRGRAANYSNVLDLEWSVVTSHLAQVVHDIAFDEYVRDTARVLLDNDLRKTMRERLGPGRLVQVDGWLKAVANEFVDTVPKELRGLQKVLNWTGSRAIAEAIGGSFRVAAGDLTNAAIAPLKSSERGGVSWKNGYAQFGIGLANALPMLVGKSAWRNDALHMSPELRHRASEHARQMQLELQRIGQNVGAITHARDRIVPYMWAMQEATDSLSATQIWWAGYNDAKGDGLAHDDAVKHADNTVRRNLPSRDLAERSALLRDRRGFGSIFIMQGWNNKVYNFVRQEVDVASLALEARRRGRVSAADAGWNVVTAAGRLAGIFLVAGAGSAWLSGYKKDEDETEGEWLTRKALGAGASAIPLAGEAGQYLVDRAVTGRAHEFNPRLAPVAAMMQNADKSIGKMLHAEEGDKRFWAAVDLALMMFGGPGKQTSRTGQYITDLMQGDVHPGPGGAILGVTGYQTAEQQRR